MLHEPDKHINKTSKLLLSLSYVYYYLIYNYLLKSLLLLHSNKTKLVVIELAVIQTGFVRIAYFTSGLSCETCYVSFCNFDRHVLIRLEQPQVAGLYVVMCNCLLSFGT